MKNVVIFGSTGSIGKNTLNVISQHRDRYRVYALSAFKQMEALAQQADLFRPAILIVPDEAARTKLLFFLSSVANYQPEIRLGTEGLCSVAQAAEVDVVVAAIVGIAGLASSFAAAQAGKTILLANKESLVAGGQVFMRMAQQSGARILPIDSEHNAIFQCLFAQKSHDFVRRLVLTASGGPFRQTPISELKHITPEQACKHPNWSMGRKISVDSATMANKGLEVIEAYYLFGVRPEQIEVLIHPQSVVHSMVDYLDGSLLAQLGYADMRIPISYALAYPERISNATPPFNLADLTQLTFELPNYDRFPCLRLAFESLSAGASMQIAFNAANEVLVDAFLNRQVRFTDIASGIQAIFDELLKQTPTTPEHLSEIIDIDAEVRSMTLTWMQYAL